jgi:16S rRNA (guanine(966)-N(2))-methyltransferase RsmD
MNLKTVPGLDTRPTIDRVKQALFNTLQFDIEGRNVLDLFAGTGQLGLESLSRGASHAVFVDNSPAALSVIKENVKKTGFSDRAEVVASDYKAFLQNAAKRSFHLVFLDPPYREGFLNRVMSFIQTFDIVKENGIIVCESAASEKLEARLGDFELFKSARYGITELTYYKRVRRESTGTETKFEG